MDVVTLGAALSIMKKMPDTAASSAAAAEDAADRAEEAARTLTIDDTLTKPGQPADSKAVGDALANKVDKVTGKGLSTEDYTTAEKTKLAGLTQIEVDDTLSVEGRAADAKTVGNEITILNEEIGNIYKEHYDHIVSPLAYVVSEGGDNISLSYSGNGFTATLVSSVTIAYGFSFPTEVGRHYNVDIDVANGSIYVLSAVKGTSYSSTTYLDKKTNVPVGKTTLSFDAVTSTTTVWFYHRYNVPSITINDISVANGWSYNNLDTVLTSERLPAQGKAVGDMLKNVPPASWLGYNNLFQITADDLKTETGDVTKTIDGNNITLVVNTSVNNSTSYLIKGLKSGLTYKFEFESDTDFTLSNQVAKITKNATVSTIGDTYAEFSKNGKLYTCTFKAIDYPLYFAIPLKYNAGTVVIANIMIKQTSVVNPKNEYCNYSGKAFTTFNRCLCIGDSLTYGGFNADNVDPDVGIDVLAQKYSYPTYLNKITGVEVVKKATGGLTSVGWWNNYGADDLSGFDVAIIQLGVNDASPSKLNGWTQASIDAFTNIIGKLKIENEGIKIFVATTVPAPAFRSAKINEVNEGIRTLVTSLADSNVIFTDINTYGHTADSIGYDAGHLTAYGYNRLAMDYVALISYLMDTNMEDFRFIQFIGTNYTYTD